LQQQAKRKESIRSGPGRYVESAAADVGLHAHASQASFVIIQSDQYMNNMGGMNNGISNVGHNQQSARGSVRNLGTERNGGTDKGARDALAAWNGAPRSLISQRKAMKKNSALAASLALLRHGALTAEYDSAPPGAAIEGKGKSEKGGEAGWWWAGRNMCRQCP
jgi:hypothetical protein